MSEKKPVIVKVRGSWQDAQGQKDSIRTVAKGHHYFHRGKHYVIYEDETVQEGAKVSTVLKIDGGMMTLLRKGILEQEQRFEKGASIRASTARRTATSTSPSARKR